jgi:pyruvate formate lyase activating enzyme
MLISPACLAKEAAKAAAVSRPAEYWERLADGVVQCHLCPRECVLRKGERGFCGARVNKDGALYTLSYGNPIAIHVDPIEKKPFFHVYPGSSAFSIAVAGCNMRCLFCQNWEISQARPDESMNYDLPPRQVAPAAKENGCDFVVFTYTEPTTFFEYMRDCAREARSQGLKVGMHSCGYVNPAPLQELLNYMDAVNVDVKGFSEEFYKKMGQGAQLKPVLETLKAIRGAGVWLELTNLVIPGENDDPALVKAMCVWIKDNLGEEVPLHFSRFMPAFRLQNLPPTPVSTLEECRRIAMEAGLKYVYIGNVPGHPAENTYCPHCGKPVVRRAGYSILENRIKKGHCGFCGWAIAGIWKD